jgi:small subunit ribosomal protein S6
MPLYEHVFLARQDVTAQQVEDMTTQYKGVIESNGGTIAKTEYWGVKTLNFRIKKNRKAHFAYIGIDGPPRPSPRWNGRCASTRCSAS